MANRKIVFVFGGVPHYYNFILNKLNKLPGTEVVVICPSKKGSSLGANVYEEESDIDFRLIRLEETPGILKKGFFKGFKKTIKDEKPDILVIGWPYVLQIFTNPFLYFFLKKQQVKIVEKTIPYQIPLLHKAASFHRDPNSFLDENLNPVVAKTSWKTDLKYGLLTRFRKYYFKKIDAFVCYVEEAFSILGSYGVKKEKIFITYNSPDTQILFKAKEAIKNLPQILPENPHRIIHIGRLVKWKKTHFLIEILPELKKQFPGIELVVIGKGPEETNLREQAKEKNVTENVRFIGGVYKPEELGQYLQASSLYVLAGVGGLSINDAMCFGKPVICSVCDGTEKKLVRDGINGYIFENDNLNDLREKISLILSNPQMKTEMGKASLSIIENEVNEKVVVEGYREAFDYVMKDH